MKFGDKLKEIRIQRGMSQEDFAKLLHTSKQVISRYETNQRTPKITIVQQYANMLHVPLMYLIDDDRKDFNKNYTSDRSQKEKPAVDSDELELERLLQDPLGREFYEKFQRLTDEQKEMMIAQMQALLKRRSNN